MVAGTKSMQAPLDPAVKKAYEVSYAIFRVAATLPSRGFAEVLEKEALNLLRATVGNLTEEAQRALNTAHYLIAFGKDTNNIHIENANLLVSQLESLASMLHDRSRNSVTPADLSQVFSSVEPRVAETRVAEGRNSVPAVARPIASTPIAAARELPNSRPANAATPSASVTIMLSDRQGLILNKIRQSGNCRTRDLQAVLPGLSERTLRYDLQRLIEDGKIERGGGGGPASWYKIKGANPQSNVSGGASL
jgi:hypothetical protein